MSETDGMADPDAASGPEAAAADLTEHLVGPDDTARALGSGDLEVLATPRLLAWCEAATCRVAAPFVPAGSTSVGTRVTLDHLAASAVGSVVRVGAELGHRDGRLLRFAVTALDVDGRLVATGEVTRVVVDVERFQDRVR